MFPLPTFPPSPNPGVAPWQAGGRPSDAGRGVFPRGRIRRRLVQQVGASLNGHGLIRMCFSSVFWWKITIFNGKIDWGVYYPSKNPIEKSQNITNLSL